MLMLVQLNKSVSAKLYASTFLILKIDRGKKCCELLSLTILQTPVEYVLNISCNVWVLTCEMFD